MTWFPKYSSVSVIQGHWTSESFDSLVGIENRKSTEVVGKKPSKPTPVLANPSVINSSDHQPFEAEAKKEKAKAKEEYELETGMKLTGKETVLGKCNQDLAQESVQDYFKGREQSSKEEGKGNTEKVNGNRWDQNDLNLRQERRWEEEQCQTSKPSCMSTHIDHTCVCPCWETSI